MCGGWVCKEDGWIWSQCQEYQHFLMYLLSSEVQIRQVNFLSWWKSEPEASKHLGLVCHSWFRWPSKGLFCSVNL